MTLPPSPSVPAGRSRDTRAVSIAARVLVLAVAVLPLVPDLGGEVPVPAVSAVCLPVAAFVCYCTWLAYTCTNAALRTPGSVPSARKACAEYFVPGVNLFMPLLTLRRIAAAGGTARPAPLPLLVAWTVAWDLRMLTGLVAPMLRGEASPALHWAAAAVNLVAGVLCVCVIGAVDAARRTALPAPAVPADDVAAV